MIKLDPHIAKESLVHVFMGTLINYPLNILFLWIIIEKWQITDPFTVSNIVTVWFSFVAFTRIYVVRYYSEKRKAKRDKH